MQAFSIADFRNCPADYVQLLVNNLADLRPDEQERCISQWTSIVWRLGIACEEFAICVATYAQATLCAQRRQTWAQWLAKLDMGSQLGEMYEEAKKKRDRKRPLLTRIANLWGKEVTDETWITQASTVTLEDLARICDHGQPLEDVKLCINHAVHARLRESYEKSEKHGARYEEYKEASLIATKRDYDRFLRRSGRTIKILVPDRALSALELRDSLPGRPLKVGDNGFLADDPDAHQEDVSVRTRQLTGTRPHASASLLHNAVKASQSRIRPSASGKDGPLTVEQRPRQANTSITFSTPQSTRQNTAQTPNQQRDASNGRTVPLTPPPSASRNIRQPNEKQQATPHTTATGKRKSEEYSRKSAVSLQEMRGELLTRSSKRGRVARVSSSLLARREALAERDESSEQARSASPSEDEEGPNLERRHSPLSAEPEHEPDLGLEPEPEPESVSALNNTDSSQHRSTNGRQPETSITQPEGVAILLSTASAATPDPENSEAESDSCPFTSLRHIATVSRLYGACERAASLQAPFELFVDRQQVLEDAPRKQEGRQKLWTPLQI